MNQTSSAANKTGTFYLHAPDSQYKTQLQFSAPHDKHNCNDNITDTTYTTMNSATNSGLMPPNFIMNNASPMGAMNSMGPINSFHHVNPVNAYNQMNNMNPIMLLLLWTSCTMETIWTLCSKTSQISNQITRWQQIEEVLQNRNRTLQNQTLRISSIENQMSEKKKSIETFSERCDEITKDKQSSDYIIGDLLENDHWKLENTVSDLQCRSMRDNLIFTGIDVVDLEEGAHEDVENKIRNLSWNWEAYW